MKRKNVFLTWVAACAFGAGQMYLGYMKRGLSLMLIAVADCFMVGFFNNEVFLLFLPVIWAYAFFDTFNLRNQDVPKPDAMLFDVSWFMGQNWKHLLESKHGLFGWVLIGVGAYALYNNFVAPTLWDIARSFGVIWLSNFLYGMPTLVVAALLVGAGIYLLKTPSQDDYVSFQGISANAASHDTSVDEKAASSMSEPMSAVRSAPEQTPSVQTTDVQSTAEQAFDMQPSDAQDSAQQEVSEETEKPEDDSPLVS